MQGPSGGASPICSDNRSLDHLIEDPSYSIRTSAFHPHFLLHAAVQGKAVCDIPISTLRSWLHFFHLDCIHLGRLVNFKPSPPFLFLPLAHSVCQLEHTSSSFPTFLRQSSQPELCITCRPAKTWCTSKRSPSASSRTISRPRTSRKSSQKLLSVRHPEPSIS